jgi:hypothetical protein
MLRPSNRLRQVARRAIYVIANDALGVCKVGIAFDPTQRLGELQTGSPHVLRLAHVIIHSDASGVEARAHHILASHRMHGEWFKVTPSQAIAAVDRAAARVSDGVGNAFWSVLRIISAWLIGILILLAIWVAVATSLT